MAYLIGNKTVLNCLIIWLIQLTTKRPYYMADSIGNKTDNKTALLYGLFSWHQNAQQNLLIIWLIQLTTNRPYCMAYSVGNKTALLYGLFNSQQSNLILWLIQLATKRAT